MKYFNPVNGNPEEWEVKPEGYLTESEFYNIHPNKCFAVVNTNCFEIIEWRGAYTPSDPTMIEMQSFPTSPNRQTAQADGTWLWDLAGVKADKKAELTTARDSVETENVTTSKGTFEFDDLSQSRLLKAMNAMTDSSTRNWTEVNGNVVTMTKADFQAIFDTAATRSDTAYAKLRTLKTQVDNATTVEEVQAIKWEE